MNTESPLGSDQPFLGEIKLFAFGFAPRGWVQCNGQLLAIASNQALFALLGTTYGGNGTQNFALPNLQSRVPVGFGNGPGLTPRTLGEVGGEENHTLLISETPNHTHAISASTAGATQPSANGGVWCDNANAYSTAAPDIFVPTGDFSSVGGQPHENRSPYLTLNWCIATQGIFPSQN